MDYEKKYKEALERAKKWYYAPNADKIPTYANKIIPEIFPELKESEDERIRKEIIFFFEQEIPQCSIEEHKEYMRKWISWLEKQGEQIDAIENFDTEFEKQVSCLIASVINKEYEYNQGYVKWAANALLNYAKHELEKQCVQKPILEVFGFKVGDTVRLKDGDGRKHIIKSFEEVKGIHGPNFYQVEFEDNSARDGIYPGEEYPNGYYTKMEKFEKEQKPADKVEPKLKVKKGEWYVCTETFVLRGKIIAIKGQTYQSLQDDTITCEDNCLFIDRHDGKASDYFRLWTIQDAKDGDVLVFDDIIMIFKNIKTVCTANTYILYCDEIVAVDEWCDFGHNARPATKEQRDLLFQKMHEAGYEWNAEKKELKKIKQTSSWSEDDEVGLGDAMWAIEQARGIAKDENDMGNLWYAERWLKSVKERMKGEAV